MDRILPHSKEIEKCVLAAMLVDPKCVKKVLTNVDEDYFYDDAHKQIFRAVMRLDRKSIEIDMVTVKNQLSDDGMLESVGGVMYIMELTEVIATSAHVIDHCRILAEKYIRRRQIHIAQDTIGKVYDNTHDTFELVNEQTSELIKLSNIGNQSSVEGIERVAARVLIDIDDIRSGRKKYTGIPTGWAEMDRFTGGWQKGNLIIVGARPGMGKSTFALEMAVGMAEQGNAGAFFSLEMPKDDLTKKIFSSKCTIDTDKMRNPNKLTDNEVLALSNMLLPDNLYIDDTASISLSQIVAKINELVETVGIKWAIIDYLQLMGGDSRQNREQEIASISRGLKVLSQTLGIPIIALSQLSRKVEERSNKRPMLSDLRESGAIEQDANIVCFIYRPEYYDIMSYEDGASTAGVMEIIFAKHRSGALDTLTLKCDLRYSQIKEFGDFNEPQKIEQPPKFTAKIEEDDIPF